MAYLTATGALTLSLLLSTSASFAQAFPAKPLRIVTAETGGTLNFVSRVVAEAWSENLGQRVLVENRGLLAIDAVAKAPPDGHAILFYGSSLWLTQFVRDNVSWDPVRDFSPITLTHVTPNVLAVHPSVPAPSVAHLVKLAKRRPGQLNYSTGSPASPATLSAELFNAVAGVNIVRIPYKGTGPALTALVSGEVDLMFPVAPSAVPHMQSGKLRGLAVTSLEPSSLVPGRPPLPSPASRAMNRFRCSAPSHRHAPPPRSSNA